MTPQPKQAKQSPDSGKILIIDLDQNFNFASRARWITEGDKQLYQRINPAFMRRTHFVDVTKINEYPPELFEGVKPNPLKIKQKEEKQ